jgi:hypothetical protein
MIKNRSTLKGYFTKGAIPTESNFADLVDSMLNQEDDNIGKLPNDPLRITATGVDEALINFFRLDQNQETLAWQVKQKPGGKSGLSFGDDTATRLFIEGGTGNLSIGTTTPVARLDISQEPRSGTHPTAVKGLYVTGGILADNNGIEFRHSNGTQGLGFGYNTIYATGSNANQDLGLKPRGTGRVISFGPLQVSGAQLQLDGGQKITFTDADVSNNLKLQLWSGYGLGINGGTLFYAANGRHSWRDANGVNERMFLNTAPDGGLTVSGTGASSFTGNLGIGTGAPVARLEVVGLAAINNGNGIAVKSGFMASGSLTIGGITTSYGGGQNWNANTAGLLLETLDNTEIAVHDSGTRVASMMYYQGAGVNRFTIGRNMGWGETGLALGNSDLYFTKTDHTHTGFGNAAGFAAIENSAAPYNALMILGRAGTPAGRNVAVWDCLTVFGTFINNSDQRAKKDIADLGYGLKEILKLRPVEFNWKNIPNPHKSIGFIAQEVQPVIGEVVYDNNVNPSEGNLSIAYINLVPVLVNAIKELSARLNQLENGPLTHPV